MGGAISPAELHALCDADGVPFKEARESAGYSGDLNSAVLRDDSYDYFVELHIEQGPVLEARQLDIGKVSAIAAPASFNVDFRRKGGHAGARLIADREDALVPAGHLITAAERLARRDWRGETGARERESRQCRHRRHC